MSAPAIATEAPAPVFRAQVLAELDAGRRRAAWPDPRSADGWRVDRSVKEDILACFSERSTRVWRLGDLFEFRDRVGLPPKDLLDGPEAEGAFDAGRPWRVVPGGTSVRAGSYLGPGVTIMPPSFINVGAWIGEDTMVDSHVLVGSCAQIGSRVHLSAGVTIGGVLEPRGARPVIVEDGAFVGGGCGLYEGVLVGGGAVLAAGIVLTGTSRLYDLTGERVLSGTAERPLAVPPGAVVVPGTRGVAGGFGRRHGLGVSTALIVKWRDAGTDARVALEDALR
ncbi:MAG TPA: 2,3,4,5-tetrahydropyridine-2,6-dicarboxylate N-succinyltransferase [Candidatus Limnocylindrales bacterium]